MTPLFHRIARELTLPKSERTFNDQVGLLGMLDDVHCFECTEISDAATELWNTSTPASRKAVVEARAFLPAPKTWLEWKDKEIGRIGVLSTSDGNYMAFEYRFAGVPTLGAKTEVFIASLLPFINTPRVIGRTQHMPHAGLERRLLRSMGGRFAVHAWHEIRLHVTPPDISEDDHEAHLTGQRALHFCRAHLRIRLGQLQLVSAHWRGDAALGIKQARYKMVMN
jgi:hypothetical protein